MSATAQVNPTSGSIRSADIALQPVPPRDSQNPSPLSPNKVKEKIIDVNFKGKTLTELKQEFEKKCAEIDKEHPELVRKDGNRWNELHEILKDRDKKAVKNHYENIDTLLVFAGLYSAILTAFVVEAYKLLQRDSSDASLQVLIQISQQLGSFAVNSGFANATYVPPSLPTGTFTPAQSSVWLNGLWFVALILSLATASLGMLVKQWLREYLNLPDVAPDAQRRIQLFRVRGLRKYKVSEIAAFLPLLLQISLILFFAGLVLFTRSVHATIGWVITSFVVAWGTFLIITTILPWFSASCPYKTPYLKSITLQFKRVLNYLNGLLERIALEIDFDWLYYRLPSQLFTLGDAETQASKVSWVDTDILADAYKTSGNANVWETVIHCAVDPQDPSASLARLPSVINRRHFPTEESKTLTRGAWRRLSWDERRLFVRSLAPCIRLRIVQAFDSEKEHSELGDEVIDSLLQLNQYSDDLILHWGSSRVDRALGKLSSVLLEGALSAPFAPGSISKFASKLLEGGVGSLRKWQYFGNPFMIAFLETSKHMIDLGDGANILHQCGGIIFCAGRSTEESRALLQHEIPQISRCVASKMKSLPGPSGWQDPQNVFKWHCVLDITMKLHKRIPGIIDKALFEALHTHSVKMFSLYVEDGKFGKYIKGKHKGVSRTSDALIRSMDWDQVLGKYAEVELRDRGEYTEYRDQWDYQRLQVDCQHRMEFMLNYEHWFEELLRSVLKDHKF